METEEEEMVEVIRVTWKEGRNGDPITQVHLQVAFPARDWNAPLPKIGEVWDVKITGKSRNGRALFLTPIGRIGQLKWPVKEHVYFLRQNAERRFDGRDGEKGWLTAFYREKLSDQNLIVAHTGGTWSPPHLYRYDPEMGPGTLGECLGPVLNAIQASGNGVEILQQWSAGGLHSSHLE